MYRCICLKLADYDRQQKMTILRVFVNVTAQAVKTCYCDNRRWLLHVR